MGVLVGSAVQIEAVLHSVWKAAKLLVAASISVKSSRGPKFRKNLIFVFAGRCQFLWYPDFEFYVLH